MAEILKAGQYREGADPRLVEILSKAAEMSGYRVEFKSGYRPSDTRQHSKKNALDITLIDPQTGKRLPDYQSPENFRTYEQFAQTARQIQRADYPELDSAFRWGGYFSGGKKKYGAMDLMHFDVAGERIGMAGGSWNKGLTASQKALWPGVESVGFNDHPVPKGSVPQVATLTDTAPPAVTPASLPPELAFTRQMTLPSYNVTPVLDRSSNKNIDNRKDVSVNSGINIPLQNAGIPPLPQMRPPAPGYKMAGKTLLSEDRFASGMADKTPPGATRVASLAPMVPMPRPRPEQIAATPKTVAPDLINDTFATLGFERNSGGVKVADLYKGILPASAPPPLPRPRPALPSASPPSVSAQQTFAGQDRAPQRPLPSVSPPRPVPQSFAGQDRMPPRPVTKTVMVQNPAYVAPKTAAPGAGLSEAQMRAIRGDMSMVPPKPVAPAVPQFIPQTVTVPAPQYTPPKAQTPQPQGQQNGLLGNLMGALPKVDFGQIKDNVINAMGPAMLGSVAGRTALMKHVMRQNISPAPNAVPGLVSGGTPVHAVNNQGMTTATLMRPTGTGRGSEASRAFDEKVHAGQNMDVYRANRAATGGPISQKSIDNAIRSGKTLFKAS